MIFRQFFEPETSTYTYLLGDVRSREAVLVDSVREMVERDLQWLNELNLKLAWLLETHVHADHVTGASSLRQLTGARIALAQSSGIQVADRLLVDGDRIAFGGHAIEVLATPGHTDSCLSYLVKARQPWLVMTGDSLMIRAAGRCDFQQGSAARLYSSIHQKLFTLPDDTLVYPGHDYKGQLVSSIGLEKQFNPRVGLGKSEADFVKIMAGLNLAPPKKIAEAVPANLRLGEIQ